MITAALVAFAAFVVGCVLGFKVAADTAAMRFVEIIDAINEEHGPNVAYMIARAIKKEITKK